MLEFDADARACADLRVYLLCLYKASFLIGGRVTVMVNPAKPCDAKGSDKGDKIVACALWLPPRTRLAVWMVPTMLKAGAILALKRWGWTGLFVRIPISNIMHLKPLQRCSENRFRIPSQVGVKNAQYI